MRVEEVNGTNCRSYLLVAGRACALVDPVRERFDTYRAMLAERDLKLEMVLETHTHADHMMMSRAALQALGAPCVMHEASPSPLVTRHVRHGDVLSLGGEEVHVLHTPGHTPDCVSYRVEGAVLTGDTLLIGGSGRTDLQGGDAGAQYDSVTQRLFTLPEGTLVWPAHDYKGRTSSTIGAEKRDNPRFANTTRDGYIEKMRALSLPFPDRIQQALQVNQSGFECSEVGFPDVASLGELPAVEPADLASRLGSGTPPLLVDVREPEEFVGELGHVRGSLLVPLDALEHRLPKLAGYVERDVVVVCRAGARSASAGAMLRRAGFTRVFNLRGGMLAWTAAGLPVDR